MEQLGLYEKLASLGMPLNKLKTFAPGGRLLSDQPTAGDLFEEVFGYRMFFLDRQALLQTLYYSIGDKSRICTSSEVFKVETLDGRAFVTTRSGTVYHGDIVIGADGVRSRIREEMWRIADVEDSSYPTDQLRKSITCTYKCLFGISQRPDGIPDKHGFKTFQEGRSYLYQSGRGGKLYWFLFIKNPEVTIHHSIPRHSAENTKDVVEKYAGDILLPGLTLGDLYKLRVNAVLVPVEEFVLDRCFYKRAVLIGDAFHKMNPLTGHGGNSAIESAAMLADLLKEALDRGNPLDDMTIQRLFSKLQTEREPRTRSLMQAAQTVQRLKALDTPFLKFLNFFVLSKLRPEVFLARMAPSVTPSHILRYMPLEGNKGRVAPDSQVQVNPGKRSTLATRCWATSMLIISFSSFVLARSSNFSQMANPGTLVSLEAYTSMMVVITNSLWVVESYRLGLLFSPLCSAIPFTLACIVFGRAIIIPMYFAIHTYATRDRSFYYPSPRGINVWIAKSLPICFVTAYALPFMHAMAWIRYSDGQRLPATTWPTLSGAHLIMPLVLRLGRWVHEKNQRGIPPVELVCGNQDIAYLSRFFTLLLYLAIATHLAFASSLWSLFKAGEFWNLLNPTATEAGCLGIAILAWCYFVLWDLRRVKIMETPLPTALILVFLGSVLLGPAATLAALWRWKERAMEACRKRK